MAAPFHKSHPHHLPADLVSRTRLNAIFTHGLEQKARLFLVTAAAGYGKSTAINAWLEGNSIKNVWMNLDSSDDDPAKFHDLLLDALGESGLDKPEATPSQTATDQIIQRMSRESQTTLYVFDRLEQIRSCEIHALLLSLVEQLPVRHAIVLISRKNPNLPVSRMRASNQLVEIDEHELRFNLNETRQFVESQTNGPIPAENLEAIHQKTQGWIAGLRLAVEQLGNELCLKDSSAVRAFSGASRYTSDYFNEEVFSKENSSMQDLMVKISLLESFSKALCDSLFKSKNIENQVDTLIDNHLFCFPVENQAGWFYYQPLFRDYLNSRCNSEEKKDLNLKASRWFQEHEMQREAVIYGLRSGDEASAIEIIEPAGEQAILEADIATLEGWLADWSANGFTARPELLVYQGWINALKGDFVQALVMTERAEEMIKARSRERKRGEADSLQITHGKLAALRAFIHVMYTHQYDAALREAKNARKLLPKNRSAWNLMALWAQAETQKRTDHIGKSIETLYEAMRMGKSLGGKIFTTAIVNSLAAALYFYGRRGEALDVCQKTIARSSDPDDPALGGIYAWIARLNFEANQLDPAKEFIDKALKLSEKAGVDLNLIFCHYYASQIYQAGGELSRALEAIKHAQSLASNATLSDESWLNAWEANLNLLQGNLLQVEHWARREGPALTQKPDYLNMEMMLVHARYLIQTGGSGGMAEAAKRLREMEKLASQERLLPLAADHLPAAGNHLGTQRQATAISGLHEARPPHRCA